MWKPSELSRSSDCEAEIVVIITNKPWKTRLLTVLFDGVHQWLQRFHDTFCSQPCEKAACSLESICTVIFRKVEENRNKINSKFLSNLTNKNNTRVWDGIWNNVNDLDICLFTKKDRRMKKTRVSSAYYKKYHIAHSDISNSIHTGLLFEHPPQMSKNW